MDSMDSTDSTDSTQQPVLPEALTSPRTPKSFILFVGGVLLGLFAFVPLIIAGLALERVPLLLAGALGLAVAWLPAAYMGFLFTARLAAGWYKGLGPKPWREQLW